MPFRDKLPLIGKKPYDRYHYDMADDARLQGRAFEVLGREGKDWHYIRQGTKIVNNGVYVPAEEEINPILIDYVYNATDNPEIYTTYLRKARGKLSSMSYRDDNLLFLPRAVYETVHENMKRADGTMEPRADNPFDTLSEHMAYGSGPLYEVLTCAALLDMVTPGIYASVQTGMRFNQEHVDDCEVRCWVEYEEPRSRGERITIIDPKANICAPLEVAMKKSDWDYRRHEAERHPEPKLRDVSDSECAIVSLADYIARKNRDTPKGVD